MLDSQRVYGGHVDVLRLSLRNMKCNAKGSFHPVKKHGG